MAKNSLSDIIRLTYNDGQPPLYYFFLKAWMFLFGDSEVATRTFSLVCFELLVFIFWKFLRKQVSGSFVSSKIGLLLLCFNPALIYFAFEARVYMLFMLIVLLSNLYLWQKKYVLWCIAALIGLYTNNFMIFIIPFQLFWIYSQIRKKSVILHYMLWLLIGYLPWIGVFVHQSMLIKNDFWVAPVGFGTLENTIAGIYFAYENDPVSIRPLFFYLSLALLPIFLFGGRSKLVNFLQIGFWGPLILILLISVFVRSIFLPRYLSFLIPTMIFLLTIFLSQLPKNIRLLFFSLALLLNIYVSALLYPFRLKPDIRSAVNFILADFHQEDVIYTTSLNFFETKYYFAKFAPKSYTDNARIKIYSKTNQVPFFVGKVLIQDEDITNKILPGKRIFTIDQEAKVRNSTWYR
jgi:hypothetical protein